MKTPPGVWVLEPKISSTSLFLLRSFGFPGTYRPNHTQVTWHILYYFGVLLSLHWVLLPSLYYTVFLKTGTLHLLFLLECLGVSAHVLSQDFKHSVMDRTLDLSQRPGLDVQWFFFHITLRLWENVTNRTVQKYQGLAHAQRGSLGSQKSFFRSKFQLHTSTFPHLMPTHFPHAQDTPILSPCPGRPSDMSH